jgi:ribosome-binding factor A
LTQTNEKRAYLFLLLAHNQKNMDSRRQLKVGSVIQQAFTDILLREGKSIYGKAFVTVTKVKVTTDLGLARFYLSVYNTEDAEAVVENFNLHKHELKRKLIEKLRHQLRVMPEIEFFRDETLDYAFHMDEVFKKIKEEDEKLKSEVKTRAKQTSTTKKKAPAKRKAK